MPGRRSALQLSPQTPLCPREAASLGFTSATEILARIAERVQQSGRWPVEAAPLPSVKSEHGNYETTQTYN